jgi:thiol-disulfide isomerase/thioredoxin
MGLAVAVWAGLLGMACKAPAPAVVTRGPRMRVAQPGEVAPQVVARMEAAAREGRRVLVYVGASWCEPCSRFRDEVATGRLDAELPLLDLLEFDLDVDADRLAAAGYRSNMIPLLAIPGADGRATGRQMAGSIKGPGAPAEMTGRLKALLGP